MAGRLALVGSGEYLPVLSEVEDWLFADNDRVYVQLATASAPEGDARLGYWHDLGRKAHRDSARSRSSSTYAPVTTPSMSAGCR